jgi:two-component system sensor histidine kinase HydH
MNEKRFLLLILTILFLLMALMTGIVAWSQVEEKMVRFLHENEKMLNRFYQIYVNEGDLESNIPEEVHGLGFYNYYKEPLFLNGDAPDHLLDLEMNRPRFNREKGSVFFIRDLLNPFLPMLDNEELIKSLNENLNTKVNQASEDEKKEMIRFIYYEIADSPIVYFKRRYYSILAIVIAAIFMVLIYIGQLSVKNMRYRDQIESQERLVALGGAARTLSHEIKNPLSAIRLQSSIIRRSGCDMHEPSLKIIENEVERLAAMTERVGDFLRHPEGNPCPVDLSGELERILDKRTESFSRPDSVEGAVLKVLIDPERLSSIIDNLVNNALESGCDPTDIRVTLDKKGHEAHILVKDRGRGISTENLNHLFDPFFTTKSKGTGVGLSIVKSFVGAVDGDLKIHSVEGEGTEALVVLPLLKES